MDSINKQQVEENLENLQGSEAIKKNKRINRQSPILFFLHTHPNRKAIFNKADGCAESG